MKKQEELLITLVKAAVDSNNKNGAAIILQSYIAENGFLSEDAGNIVKGMLNKLDN